MGRPRKGAYGLCDAAGREADKRKGVVILFGRDLRELYVAMAQRLEKIRLTIKHRGKRINAGYGIYEWRFGARKIYATETQIIATCGEYLSGAFTKIYPLDFNGKIVLDIGGFNGDTAMYFIENGAKHVICYEALAENIETARLNLECYKGKVELHKAFICDREGDRDIRTAQRGEAGFREHAEGRDTTSVHCMPLSEALSHDADIVKMDCEGCEYYLAGVSDSLVGKFPLWVVEFHLDAERHALFGEVLNKFYRNGHEMKHFIRVNDVTYVIILSKEHGKGAGMTRGNGSRKD